MNSALLTLSLLFAATATAEMSLLKDFTVRRWTLEDGLPGSLVLSVEQRADGYLWCRTPHGVARFDGMRFVPMPIEMSAAPVAVETTKLPPGVRAEEVTTTLAGQEDEHWVGTAYGVYRWREGQWSELTARDGVFPCDARCLVMDREGNIWMGTSGGLLRLRRKRVTVFRSGLPAANDSITALLAESPTNFWVGVAGMGLLRGAPEKLRPVTLGHLRSHATVSSLLRGRDGTLWVGTQGDSLWRLDAQGRITPPTQRAKLLARGITALLEDRRGRVWVGTWRGLMRVSEAGELEPVDRQPSDMVHVLCEDQAGRIWVGYQQSGMFCFESENLVKRYEPKDGLPEGPIFVIYADPEGSLWLGTTGGLVRWTGTTFQCFTTRNGLVDDVVLQIVEDEAAHLWLGTRRGLMRVRKGEFDEIAGGRKLVAAARSFGIDAGMSNEECTGRMGARATRTSDGSLWFPTMEGLVRIHPKDIPPPPTPPPVYVEEVLARDQPVPQRAGTAQLPRGVRDVEIRFTAPTFTVPERTHFKFRLEGRDSDWSRATEERSVRYTQLSPGAYRFRVMARDRDSAWSEPTPALAVVVPPFFWETVWFAVVVGAATLALTVSVASFYYRRRGLRELRKMENQTALERERARIARDIHDEVGAGLTEVAMLSELAQEDEAYPEQLRQHLDGIFRRARAMIQSLDEIVWAINPIHDTLESFLSYIGEFAQDFLAAANVACRLDLPADPPPLGVPSTVRHHLCLAVKEVLHNTIKHAEATEVRLTASLSGHELTVTIQDNGRGFSSEAAPGANVGCDGLGNLRARLAEIRGRFLQESRPGGGTRTVLSVELPTGDWTTANGG